MSTRGAAGIRLGGNDKIGYNHYDSYPSGLGNEILGYLKRKSVEELKREFEEIELDDSGDNDVWDWSGHCFCKKFDDYRGFMGDSLFNEWSYLINLDDGILEIYKGFNKNPNADGRYASMCRKNCDGGYFGVELILEIPLDDLFRGEYEIKDDKFVKRNGEEIEQVQ